MPQTNLPALCPRLDRACQVGRAARPGGALHDRHRGDHRDVDAETVHVLDMKVRPQRLLLDTGYAGCGRRARPRAEAGRDVVCLGPGEHLLLEQVRVEVDHGGVEAFSYVKAGLGASSGTGTSACGKESYMECGISRFRKKTFEPCSSDQGTGSQSGS
jgi:hypothetical protein